MRDAFDAWLCASEDNRQAWQQALRVWSVLGEAGEARREGFAEPARRAPIPSRSARWPGRQDGRSRAGARRFRPILAACAAVAAVLVLVIALPSILLRMEADYITGIAEVRQVQLEDGTLVTLDADSAIAVDFSQQGRSLRILKGDAFFDVTPDASRPFRVSARDTRTTVLGTGFEVRLLPDSVAVAVDHGRVDVSWSAGSARDALLGAGERVEIDAGGEAVTGRIAPDMIASWRSGKLVVEDRPLSDVVDAVRRHFPGSVIALDGDLLTRRVTGVYDLSDPEEALRAAVRVQGGNVQQITPWILLIGGA